MKNTIHRLWIDHTEEIFNRNRDCPKIKELTALIQHNRNELCRNFSEESKRLLEAYDDCYAGLHDLYFEQVFAGGFRLGMQLALAGLYSEK